MSVLNLAWYGWLCFAAVLYLTVANINNIVRGQPEAIQLAFWAATTTLLVFLLVQP